MAGQRNGKARSHAIVFASLLLIIIIALAVNVDLSHMTPGHVGTKIKRLRNRERESSSDSVSENSSGGVQNNKSTVYLEHAEKFPICNITPPNLEGPIDVIMEPLEWAELNKLFPEVEEGGRWRPKHCKSRHHMGIVIPYRDRDAHLRTYLRHMHKFWAKQELDYGVYVIEQDIKSLFNRGMLMNIGFVEALKVANYSCFIFSDVDLIPEDDRNIYGCPDHPRLLSVAIDTWNYEVKFPEYFGGVENFRAEHYKAVNGFGNLYFGWGGEDDDLGKRLVQKQLKHTKAPIEIARYKMQSHKKAPKGPYYLKLRPHSQSRMDWDGLNSLQYEIVRYEKRPLYTLISVVLNQTAVLQAGHMEIKR